MKGCANTASGVVGGAQDHLFQEDLFVRLLTAIDSVEWGGELLLAIRRQSTAFFVNVFSSRLQKDDRVFRIGIEGKLQLVQDFVAQSRNHFGK